MIWACTCSATAQDCNQADSDNCSYSSLPSDILSQRLTQTHRRTCVLTPKSHSLTCPRVFTSILEGLTSVETNCLRELQNQHSVACLYQPGFFFLNNSTTLLTSVKNLQTPQICQAFDYLQTQTEQQKIKQFTENCYKYSLNKCPQHPWELMEPPKASIWDDLNTDDIITAYQWDVWNTTKKDLKLQTLLIDP